MNDTDLATGNKDTFVLEVIYPIICTLVVIAKDTDKGIVRCKVGANCKRTFSIAISDFDTKKSVGLAACSL